MVYNNQVSIIRIIPGNEVSIIQPLLYYYQLYVRITKLHCYCKHSVLCRARAQIG